MAFLSTTHLKQWVNENQHLFNPPFRTNKLLVSHKDFIVMMLRGPNTRLDFHIDPGDEGRQTVKINQGEIFVCPGGVPHSPRRFETTWGLVIERKRRPEEQEEFVWFCEQCDALVLSRVVNQGNIPAQVTAVYTEFNNDPRLRTCNSCGYVFPETPMAERLSFLEKS